MILTSEDAQTILKALLEIGVYVAVIFGAILVFRAVCKNRIRPALRFALWFLLLLRLTVPFTVNLQRNRSPYRSRRRRKRRCVRSRPPRSP